MSLRVSRILRLVIPKGNDYPKPRPVITRARSWRGLMQVRYDDTRADRQQVIKQALIWAPVRVLAITSFVVSWLYFFYGHDVFMFNVFGYESEAMIEGRMKGTIETTIADVILGDRGAMSPLRELEVDLHPQAKFDIMKTGAASYNATTSAAGGATAGAKATK